ncbi:MULTISPECIES: maleylpyruvate isomerase N-terminal domain-containing protein [unclassified Arthrobacter]|uniref:maleylpyruvate isomerase N-terminal domain-containing protein n=1 Tax=unclassified Arthrobacter TaxID=235627 RepID=UPI001D13E91A|nr:MULTISPECIES: maleylpyruvate isomerase N-terminal domain-containing protein [unclassified Arthrobacter]MCC3290214.1 maleylpyruvate isomerase N-terminal domain-containing protein [Arthrobacter sp. zg-Y1110]MCC3300275.1 maleylpyruvate isomerase N-terminal domain-containing protein [Arthrobacter sp. zg-Y895]UWX84402.1 maleylpyruvate isomerase N-terminal domain-containing protein [Arthrobacter sp. zg-Y1110]
MATFHNWRTYAVPFSAVVADTTDWDAATPCTEWTARDVVEHVVMTQRDFLAQHGLLPAGPAGIAPDGERPDLLWKNHESLVAALLSDAAVAGREFDGYFGPSTIGATIVEFYGVDLLTHRWDLAVSQGLDPLLTGEDLDAIDAAMDSFGEQAYAPGLFARPVGVPDSADRRAVVLARTGRRA